MDGKQEINLEWPKDRADHIYCIRAMGHQENKICPSKAGLYGAQLVHILTTLLPLCTIYQRAFYDSKSWYLTL